MGLSSSCHKYLNQGRKVGGQVKACVQRGKDETGRPILSATTGAFNSDVSVRPTTHDLNI